MKGRSNHILFFSERGSQVKVPCGRRDEMHPEAPVGKYSIFGRKPALTVRQYQLPVSYKSEWNRVLTPLVLYSIGGFFYYESRESHVKAVRFFPPRGFEIS